MPIQTVREVMTTRPECCRPNEVIAAVARRMAQGGFGAVPVVEPRTGTLVGIITDRDITCRITARGMDPTYTLARQAMTDQVATLGPDATIHDCVQLMARRQVRRVPVVNGQGAVLGIVAQADLARASNQEPELEHEMAEMVEEVSEPPHVITRG